MAHDPGNSSHWAIPHPGFPLTGPVDAAVYQSAQLAYPESSQRTIVSPDAYLYYGDVRTAPHSLSAPQQLPREPYDQLGQGYYSPHYGYPAFVSLAGSGTYESADSTARDEGTYPLSHSHARPARFTQYFPTQTHKAHIRCRASRRPRTPAMSPPTVATPRSRATRSAPIPSTSSLGRRLSSVHRVRSRMVPTMVSKLFVSRRRKRRLSDRKLDSYSAQRSPSPAPRSANGQKRGGRITLKKTNPSSKRSKMHQCAVCEKWFPRPSGLATHMNSHSGMKRKGDNIGRDCGLGLMERNDSLSVPGRVLQQIVCRPLQRKATSSDTRHQSSGRDDEQGPGIHRRVRDTDGVRRSTGEPSAGDAQVGSAESYITDDDRVEQQVERLGERWRGQFPYIVCAAIARDPVVVGMGLWLLERGIHVRGGRQPPVPPTSRKRPFRRRACTDR